MSKEDEDQFLDFLRGTCEIELMESFAPTTEELWVSSFNENFSSHSIYRVWNKEFDWVPEYGTVGCLAHNPDHIGWRYISNSGQAPILEVMRSSPDLSRAGRLYWGRDFSAPRGLLYDAEAFSLWIDKVWRWVRKNGRKLNEFPGQPYALPGALARVA